jgi:hypothetical protein
MKLFVTVAILVAASSTFALTIKEKKQFNTWKEDLKGPVATFKAKCGHDLSVSMEEKAVTPFMEADTHFSSYCESAVNAMNLMCEDKISKDAITKIKKVNCKVGEKGKVSYKFSGDTLEMTVGLEAPNLEAKTKEFLENNI